MDWLKKMRDESAPQASEALDHLYRRLLWTPPFTLTDGTPARISGFIEPRTNEQGELMCGVDVLLGDDAHLEFIVKQGGWGRAINVERTPPKPSRGRGR